MATTTSLNVQALLKAAVARNGMDKASGAVSGLNDPAKALYAAAAAHAMPRGAVLLVVPGDRDVDQMVRDVRFFLASLDGLSDAAVERKRPHSSLA